MHQDIRPFLSHQTLVVAWGDFPSGEIRYDVTSSRPGVNTRALHGDLDPIMTRLHGVVIRSCCGWVVLKVPRVIATYFGFYVKSPFYREFTSSGSSLLVHAMRDERESHDCLYLFSIAEDDASFDPIVLDLIMPHLDAALRRVKCLKFAEPGGEVPADHPCVATLSAREQEVLHWVGQGKSNEEIGAILGISHNTVKNHLKRIFNKMGVTARSQAVRDYMQGDASHT